MQPVTACSSLMEVLPREMKPLMSCDSDRRAVTRTKARLPLCEVWFTSEEPERESLKVHLLYSAIYFRGESGRVFGSRQKPIRAELSGGFRTHTVIYSPADNKSLLVLLFLSPITAWFKSSKASQETQTIYITFSPHFTARCPCSQDCCCVFFTGQQSPPGTKEEEDCDSRSSGSHPEFIFCWEHTQLCTLDGSVFSIW